MRRRLLPSLVLGIGLGGFVDGILMHQVFQWHHMISAQQPMDSLAGLEDNTLADGIFHVVTWSITVYATMLAWRAWKRGQIAPPWSAHVGALLAGWGIFNLLDSANHFILGLHHIRDDLGGPLGWDLGFLLFALALVGSGGLLARRA